MKANPSSEKKQTAYQLVLKKRNRWIYNLDKTLDSLDLKKSLWFSCSEKEECSSKVKRLLKAKLHKQLLIKEVLKEQEESDPFGYEPIKNQAKLERRKTKNPYILNLSTMKSLLNDIRRQFH